MPEENCILNEDNIDLLIVGSGAGSVVAALVAKDHGLNPLIVEKLDVVGGTTSYSGGVAWIPNNPVMARHGIRDSFERGKQYLDAAIWYSGPATTAARKEAFLQYGPDMVHYLETKGMKFVQPGFYPDYHSDLPGAEQHSRSLCAEVFDLNELGEWKSAFAGTDRPVMRFSVEEAFNLSLFKRTWASRKLLVKIVLRMLYGKLTGKDLRGAGAALQGRLLQIALREGIPLWRSTPVKALIVEHNRVVGVTLERQGKEQEIRAKRGVLLNAGGFAHNTEMRHRYGRQPAYPVFSNASPGDTGEMMNEAMSLGADTDCLDEALWGLASMEENGDFPGGSAGSDSQPPPGHHFDISLPHSLVVDQLGQRFTNEADSYMTVGQKLYARNNETGGKAIPAYAIIESRHRQRYAWGMTLGKAPQSWFDSGYMKKANSLEELAQACGIDSHGLQQTVNRFNQFCETGNDDDFQRGSKAFDNCHGDASVQPNPNLGAIEKPPFYAVAIYPGDVSTWGGVITDEYSRVLTKEGKPIDGLYATGTTTASVFGRTYPGAGASIGPSMVFGFVAAQHVCGQNSKP